MNKTLKKDLLVWVIVFGVLTLPFIFSNIDIKFQSPFYNATDGWYLAKVPFWDFIYKYGIFLGYFLVVIALVILSLSYWKKTVVKWRRPAFFLLVVMIIGPGVLVNATLKDHWGHPRPREIKEFDGKEDYVKVWVKGETKGKSFPCGHASMGFFMSIPFLFLRNRYKKWAWTFFIFGTAYGLLIGIARMIAGGHFASDVVWAAGIVWITGITAYHLMKVNKSIDITDFSSPENRKKRRLATILVGAVLPVLTVGLLLATPYISNRKFGQTKSELESYNIKTFDVKFNEGVVNVLFSNDFLVDFTVNAFGFPNSKMGWNWIPGEHTSFELIRMGWFTEVRNEIDFHCPENCDWQNNLNVVEGNVYITIPEDTIQRNLNLNIETGDVYLTIPENTKFGFNYTASQIVNENEIVLDSLNAGALKLQVNILKEGKLLLLRP